MGKFTLFWLWKYWIFGRLLVSQEFNSVCYFALYLTKKWCLPIFNAFGCSALKLIMISTIALRYPIISVCCTVMLLFCYIADWYLRDIAHIRYIPTHCPALNTRINIQRIAVIASDTIFFHIIDIKQVVQFLWIFVCLDAHSHNKSMYQSPA